MSLKLSSPYTGLSLFLNESIDMSRPTDFAITRETLMGTDIEPTYAGVLSFMRRKYSRDLEGVDVAVTGIPFDLAVSNRAGARMGPRAIRAASSNLAWGTVSHWGFDPFEQLAVVDYGDCGFDSSSPSEVPSVIEAHIEKIIEQELYGHYLKVQRQLFYSRPQQTSGPEVRIIGEKIDPAPKRADFN